MKKLVVIAALALGGCGTNTVSPALTGLPGITTQQSAGGYPVLSTVSFDRADVHPDLTTACLARGVNSPESAPSSVGTSTQVSGRAAHYRPSTAMSYPFRYTLEVRGGHYEFSRIRYMFEGSEGGPIRATSPWSPENVYSALEEVVDRVDSCRRG